MNINVSIGFDTSYVCKSKITEKININKLHESLLSYYNGLD